MCVDDVVSDIFQTLLRGAAGGVRAGEGGAGVRGGGDARVEVAGPLVPGRVVQVDPIKPTLKLESAWN